MLERLKPGYWGYWAITAGLYLVDRDLDGQMYPLSSWPSRDAIAPIYLKPVIRRFGILMSPDRKTLYTQRDQSGSDICSWN